MHKLCDYIDRELEELEEKVSREGSLSRAEIEDGKNLAKFKMALLTNEAMENDGSSGSYPMYGRRMSNAQRRDSRGRYRGSYSDARDGMIDDLRSMMQDAPDEHTRKRFQSFIRELENS